MTPRRTTLLILALLALVGPLEGAHASRPLLSTQLLKTQVPLPPSTPPAPPPDGQIEGACGVLVGADDSIFVSDYHHGAIEVFSDAGAFQTLFSVTAEPEGPCGLAADAGGALYANVYHQRVIRVRPSLRVYDTGDSTGLAIDPATNLIYVNDRTHVVVYEPSGSPVLDEGVPLQIGLGSLGDAYGLAVAAGRVYVPDAATETVKVYEPALDPHQPVDSIGGFVSLTDAAATIDPTTGHLLVVDNLEPGFEHPRALVREFAADGTPLGTLPGAPVHGEPSGIAADPDSGELLLTTGNSEESNVFLYGSFGSPALAPETETPPADQPATLAAGTSQVAPGRPDGEPLATTETRRQTPRTGSRCRASHRPKRRPAVRCGRRAGRR